MLDGAGHAVLVDVPVNGKVLEWGRRERHLSLAQAAELLDLELSNLVALERGETKPTLGLLRDIASKYKLPLAALLMPEPLAVQARPVVADYRTFEGDRPELSFELQKVLDEAWELIDTLADIKNSAPDLFPDITKIPNIALTGDIERIAEAERSRIGFPVSAQMSIETDREAFLRWRGIVEKQGVFVQVQNLHAPRDNCRGFAVNDSRQVPFIFLNSDESEVDRDYRSRIFGLFHEYCHILMRQTALSDHGRSNAIEARCNQFSAFFLMPRAAFLRECQNVNATYRTVQESHVLKLSKTFHTSMSSVAIHMETLGVAPSGFYARLQEEWKSRSLRSSSGRASHEQKLANKFGTGLLRLIIRAADRGLLNKMDVFEITGIKPKYKATVAAEIDARMSAYGGA